MTTLLDAPAPTRKERTMLERKMAATAEPETATTTALPVVEQVTTDVVMDDTNLEQSVDSVTEPAVEPVADPEPGVILEPSTHDADDDDDVFPETKQRTSALPMVSFKPLQKDMAADDVEVPYAPPMTSNPFFADDEDDDELGVINRPAFRKPLTDEELEAFDRELDAKNALAKAEEKVRKEKEAKEKAEAEAKAKKRGSRRMLGIIMMVAGAVGIIYGAIVPFIPGM